MRGAQNKDVWQVAVAVVVMVGGCTSAPGSDEGTGGAGKGGGSALGPHGGNPSTTCVAPAGQLTKLSSRQYSNTVRDLLTASGAGFAVNDVANSLRSLPADSHDSSFEHLDQRISRSHINAYDAVAHAAADAIASTSDRAMNVAGTCAAMPGFNQDCLRGFISKFGRRAFRRPLADEEISRIAQAAAMGSTDTRTAIGNSVHRMMLAPDFLYHLETSGDVKDGLIALDPHAVASRLAFHFWQSMPDDELLAAADDGSLLQDKVFATQLERVFADPRTKESVWSFYRQWFHLDKFSGFVSHEPFASFAAGLGFDKAAAKPYEAMLAEIHALIEQVTWKQAGRMADLITTDAIVAMTPELAALYGVTGSGASAKFPPNQRAGILTRAAFLVSGDEQTSPFHRGAFIRRDILCDELTPPDPSTLPPGALAPPALDRNLTTRQRFTKKTESNVCMGCHRYFNDIGYTLESYDALGRFRVEEAVYDESGKIVARLPVDNNGTPRIALDDTASLQGPVALAKAVADSGKAEGCFARQYFRFTYRRMEAEDDACLIDALTESLRAGSGNLADALKAMAASPSFRQRKVSNP